MISGEMRPNGPSLVSKLVVNMLDLDKEEAEEDEQCISWNAICPHRGMDSRQSEDVHHVLGWHV